MSDHFLALIPADPHATLPETANALCDALAEMLNATEARVKDYGKLQFIDCGQNARTIHCPACNAEITTQQWHAWMDEDWHGAEGFHLQKNKTPCCRQETTLNALIYDAPQGFAHWFVAVRVTGLVTLSDQQFQSLENIATQSLRVIRQKY